MSVLTREEVTRLIYSGESIAWLTNRGAIVTCQSGGVDLIPLASRLYFKDRGNWVFIDGVVGLSSVVPNEVGDDATDQHLHDRLWQEIPEPPRDPDIEQLVEELATFHKLKTPMEKQILCEMVTEVFYRELCAGIAETLGGIN